MELGQGWHCVRLHSLPCRCPSESCVSVPSTHFSALWFSSPQFQSPDMDQASRNKDCAQRNERQPAAPTFISMGKEEQGSPIQGFPKPHPNHPLSPTSLSSAVIHL